MTTTYIALGSNLGNRKAHIQRALDALRDFPDIQILRLSPLYKTEAVGFTCPAPSFLNGVAEVNVSSTPQQFLRSLQSVENQLGRVRHFTKEPESRTIDLDILLFGQEIIDELNLQVPHPRMMQREFVLRPLADLAPDLIVPKATCTVAQALERISDFLIP